MTDLLYTEVEEQLRSSVRDLLTDRAGWPSVLARTETDQPYDRALWRTLGAELGVSGLAVPERMGGHGASWREAAVVAEELGRCVAGTPFLGSAVLATALAMSAGADEIVRRFASGSANGAVVASASSVPGAPFPAAVTMTGGRLTGAVRGVIDAAAADQLLVPALDGDEPVVVAVDAGDVTRTAVTSLDLTRPLCDVTLDGARGSLIARGPAASDALDAALITGAAVLASEQLGLAQRCLEMTVDYLKSRYQFGRPIGGYQALKHRVADIWAGVSQARAVARYAAACVADGDPDMAVAASLAQAYCSPVAVKAAEECLQMHGGIGFTWEHPAHLYLKRAKADSILLGTAGAHRIRLGRLVDLPVA